MLYYSNGLFKWLVLHGKCNHLVPKVPIAADKKNTFDLYETYLLTCRANLIFWPQELCGEAC